MNVSCKCHVHYRFGIHRRRRAGVAPGLDYDDWLEAYAVATHEPVSRYHHNRTSEDNAGVHLKRRIMGCDA
jgi:hypothetical protein